MLCAEGYKKRYDKTKEAPLSKFLGKASQTPSFSLLPRCGMGMGIAEWLVKEEEDASGERKSANSEGIRSLFPSLLTS
jgi:hypothetical protein